MTIEAAIDLLRLFERGSLTASLTDIEADIAGADAQRARGVCSSRSINDELLRAALLVKQAAGQVNVVIHATGILRSLEHILEPGEVVESVSLGAGNTGRKFDLETNHRVAEYKFITWRGGPESIRQNGIFKDFYTMAEYPTNKAKYLYVLGTDLPRRFFRGGRALKSVLSKNPEILTAIHEQYGASVCRVRDYYHLKEHEVQICDVSPFLGVSLTI